MSGILPVFAKLKNWLLPFFLAISFATPLFIPSHVSAEHFQCRVQSGAEFFWVDAPGSDAASCGTTPGFTGETRDGPHNDDGTQGDPVTPDGDAPAPDGDEGPNVGGNDQNNDGIPDDEQSVDAPSCESEGGEFSFGLCPLLRYANEGIDELDQRIRNALEVKPQYYDDADGQVRQAWGRIRNVAAILLIPIMLVLVSATALGFSFVDAYTVRRAMPRLLVAVIFMALSYDISVLMIEVTGAVGRGVGGLLAGVFTDADLTLAGIFRADRSDGALTLGTGVVGGIALVGIGALSISILASYLGVALLTLVIIFAVLTMRELVIVFLIIFSPIAILSWIFPGNDKLWKIWWDTFTKLLLVYPLIFALLVMGRIFAWLVGEIPSDGVEAVFIVLVKLTAYIGPFFFILLLLKVFTGAFGTLTGAVNDRSKGLFDRSRNFRAEKRKQLGQRAEEGNRFNSTNRFLNPVSKRTSRFAQRRILSAKAGVLPGKKKRARIDNAADVIAERVGARNKKENEQLQALLGDDDSLIAAREFLETGNRGKLNKYLETAAGGRYADKSERQRVIEMLDNVRKETGDVALDRIVTDSLPATGTGYNVEVAYKKGSDGKLYNSVTGDLAPEGAEEGLAYKLDQFGEKIWDDDRNGYAVETIADYSRMAEDIGRSYRGSMFKGQKVGGLRGQLKEGGHNAGNVSFGTFMNATNEMGGAPKAGETDDERRHRVRNTIIKNANDAVPKPHLLFGKPYGVGQNADVEFQTIQNLSEALGQISEERQTAIDNNDTALANELTSQYERARHAYETRMGDILNLQDGFSNAPLENVEVAQRRLTERVLVGSGAKYGLSKDLTVSEAALREASDPDSAALKIRGTFNQQQARAYDPTRARQQGVTQGQGNQSGPGASPGAPPGGNPGGNLP